MYPTAAVSPSRLSWHSASLPSTDIRTLAHRLSSANCTAVTLASPILGDPRIGLASVTAVQLAEDSRCARVLISVEGSDAECQESLEGLTAAVGYIRHEVADRLHLRRAPELYFQLDR